MQRYYAAVDGTMEAHDDGAYVLFDDADELQSEIEQLRQQVQDLTNAVTLANESNTNLDQRVRDLQISNANLASDNLTKTQQTVDAMAQCNAFRSKVRAARASLDSLLIDN